MSYYINNLNSNNLFVKQENVPLSYQLVRNRPKMKYFYQSVAKKWMNYWVKCIIYRFLVILI